MKIAYLVNQYPQASQSFIRREIAALESRGVQVERFTLRQWNQQLVDQADRDEQRRARVVLHEGAPRLFAQMLSTLCTRPRKFFAAAKAALRLSRRGDRGALVHLIYLAEACMLLKWFDASGIEHVHAHFGTNSATVAMLCRLLGSPPYSFTTHGPEEFDRPIAISLSEKIEHAAFAVAVSEFGRSQLYRWCEYRRWNRIHVIHCGVDASYLELARGKNSQANQIPDVPRLLCIGRLAEQKGQLVLLRAASELAADGVDFEILLIGDGPMRQEIERQIVELKIDRQVRIAGWMSNEEVRRELLASRAMVLPSFAEGLPVVIMESLAARRPVISTCIAGIPELVENNVSGWLIPAGDVQRLARAMREVLRMPVEQLARLGAAGAERVLHDHDADHEAARLAELFAGVIADLAHPRPEPAVHPQTAAET